ncbi:unnamed protein product [Didymodactylos carnosus]|uniref:Transporter n=1 Tax=Didymodactylos carnosus TaxID=1234261 RepID=A0A814MV79_9BILA|nr:unnamed protein product [Didymodactylos carnosus]CAF1083871.1 unnamed protein product [Didymodactylos carnosus]CAF3735517.1 unnamed protein product [Didymodactylos carnosus]CAF3849522.1 unnamed protein product [Didymodactylos carnosus]
MVAEEREVWDKPIELLLSLIGCAVGFGNVWRYPYIAYKNGGGAFLIPYFCMYILVGLPLYFLELALGQFASIGVSKVFQLSSIWRGLGWCMALQAFTTSIVYNMIIGWVFFYLFASFRKKLQWTTCTNWWNTEGCRELGKNMTLSGIQFCGGINNITTNCTVPKLAAAEYFENYVLQKSDSFSNFGLPTWKLSLCLLFSWILVFLCIRRGIKSSGKVVYVTALFPYVVIFALIIRAGIAIFSVMGFMADKVHLPISEVVDSGPGLAFIAYPEAMAHMPLSQLWAVLFFLMMITLGLDSQFAMFDVLISAVLDTFQYLRPHKTIVTMILCAITFLLGLPLCAPSTTPHYLRALQHSTCPSRHWGPFLAENRQGRYVMINDQQDVETRDLKTDKSYGIDNGTFTPRMDRF